jgi:hypothetical protein
MNELAKQFKDQAVFLSVSDEEPAVVESFLKNRPIEGLVGIAHTESPLARWGVRGVPETGITGRYDFKVAYDKPEGEGWIDAMRKAGFKVERARRQVEYLVVSRLE